MNLTEKAHELGKMIKESPEMAAMDKAEELQQNDENAQTLLHEFNMKRMNLARDMQSGKIQQSEAVAKNTAAFEEMVEKSETIKAYVEAKKAFDTMVQEINGIINYYITGQEPGCTHNCSTCGGCR